MTHDDDFDPFITGIAHELRRPVAFDARFDDRVMAALEPRVMSLNVVRAVRPWYRRTFAFSVSQVAGLAAAAALVGVVSMQLLAPTSSSPSAVADRPVGNFVLQPVARVTRDANAPQLQQFLLIAPSATSVALVGDFSDWDDSRYQMERVSDDGAWSITIPLVPGRYEYQFEVDGAQRVNDPTRPQTSSEFGSANSVVTVERRD
ncbi:MAG: isoamylase early set domain-containing protein [Gemmatimonadota bacterium]